jgi:hypothetical protein
MDFEHITTEQQYAANPVPDKGVLQAACSLHYERIPGVDSLHLSVDDRSAIAFNVFSLLCH